MAIKGYVASFWVYLCPKFCNHLAVHSNSAFPDILLCLSAGTDPCMSKELLEPYGENLPGKLRKEAFPLSC